MEAISIVVADDDPKICSICGEPYSGDGNEAEPVNDGRCCDDCNAKHAIPARLAKLRAAEREAGPPRQRWWMH